MTIDLHATLDFSLDLDLYNHAAREVGSIQDQQRTITGAPVEDYLDALLTVLLVRRLEKQRPGASETILAQLRAAATANAGEGED